MNRLFNYCLVFGLMLLALPSCKQHSLYKKKNAYSSGYRSDSLMQQLSARHADIPQPLGLESEQTPSVTILSEGKSSDLAYRIELCSRQPMNDVKYAYEHEMERLGWYQLTDLYNDNETILVFEKPFRLCIIILKESGYFSDSSNIAIYMGNKNE